MSKILDLNSQSNFDEIINLCAKLIQQDKVLILPTDTIYGLCANAFSKKAVERIFSIKKRPSNKPLIVLISNLRQLSLLTNEIPKDAILLIEKFWPGPLTLIFKKHGEVFNDSKNESKTIAVRLINDDFLKQVIEKSNPIVSTSANISGNDFPLHFSDISKELINIVDCIVFRKEKLLNHESTIVSVVKKPFKLVREGAISFDEISKFVKIEK